MKNLEKCLAEHLYEHIAKEIYEVYFINDSQAILYFRISWFRVKKLYNWWKKSDEAKEYIDGYWEKRGAGLQEKI
jgi:hypothetical protein